MRNALAAKKFRVLVADSFNIWSNAIDRLEMIPFNDAPTVKSLCVFLQADNLNIKVKKGYKNDDEDTTLVEVPELKTIKKRAYRTGPPCKCTDCGKEFVNPYHLNKHFKNSGQKDACVICGAILFRGKDMRDHLIKVHKETAYMCSQCPALYTNEMDAKTHKKEAHKNGLTCEDCGRTFKRNAAFETHSQMHAVRTCKTCGVQFTNRACYTEHISKCEPDVNPKDASQDRRSNLRDPETHTCHHCLKTYASRPQLENHILWIHMDVRPHKCQWCGESFFTPVSLAEHSVIHNRERNFDCDICGAKLATKVAAANHRRRHTGEKPYKCADCSECFISAYRRSEHAKRKHGRGVRLQCAECPSTFVKINELKKHMEKVHPNT